MQIKNLKINEGDLAKITDYRGNEYIGFAYIPAFLQESSTTK